jgi:hypothetical protein
VKYSSHDVGDSGLVSDFHDKEIPEAIEGQRQHIRANDGTRYQK